VECEKKSKKIEPIFEKAPILGFLKDSAQIKKSLFSFQRNFLIEMENQ
jgi:hypothetical protein